MEAVLIGIGKNNDLVIIDFVQLEIGIQPRADRADDRAYFFVGENLIQPLLLDVEGLAAEGRMDWNCLTRACFAVPPAESPSTMNISFSSGLRPEQAASLPTSVSPSMLFLARAFSFACLAARRTLAAPCAFLMISSKVFL